MATGTPARRPNSSVPAWPATRGTGRPGTSAASTRTASSTSPASPPRPEPSTTATAGRSSSWGRIARAAVATASSPGSSSASAATGSATRAGGERRLEPEDRLDRGRVDAAAQPQVDAGMVDERQQPGEPHQRRALPRLPQDRVGDVERFAGGDHATGVALVLADAVAQQDQLAVRAEAALQPHDVVVVGFWHRR